MAETRKTTAPRALKIPDFLREPIEQAQARLTSIEENAQKALKDLVEKGRTGRRDLEAMVKKLSKDDRVAELRGRLEKFRETGAERAEEWRDRAEHFRAEALDRVTELQSKAIAFLGVASRDQVAELSREIDKLARRIEARSKARKARRAGKAEA
jgi:hypothetical protein